MRIADCGKTDGNIPLFHFEIISPPNSAIRHPQF
jgi:hypothetical protein